MLREIRGKTFSGKFTRLALLSAIAAAFGTAAHAESYYLTVAGLGGEQEYEQRFTGWAKELEMILKGEPNAKMEMLTGAQATRANIQAKLTEYAKQAKADDNVVLFLIGHGGFDEADYKFNIPRARTFPRQTWPRGWIKFPRIS